LTNWAPFPHDNSSFVLPGGRLENVWDTLHAGDCEPFPDDRKLQDAWRSFHCGAFEQAVILGDDCGIGGHSVANKATGVYATYLEADENQQINLYQTAIARAERAIEALPDDPNSHYFHAFNLGRYSQSISIVKALKQGIGNRISASLEKTLSLQPEHAEAHTASGLYHAEIINKIGKMVGGITYGASESSAMKHFETALKLTPDSPIAHIEYGNGLYLLHGDRKLDEVSELYEKATELTPKDAMEKLDIEAALAEFE
jgi:tetratricopeptide (TPR) repeat protein